LWVYSDARVNRLSETEVIGYRHTHTNRDTSATHWGAAVPPAL